jgi:cytochrome c551/c552
MRAFVIRGFGQKAGVDFDQVHAELIAPALQQVGIDGGTTGDIVEAGNVREDMFRELVLADIVVADVSVHNANVFYELGVRHAVKNRATVLIRARIDDVPFDLRTDRYLSYDPASAAASVPQLVRVLRETLATERADSPVFQLLPGFAPSPHATLLDLPRDLAEDIEQAREARRAGDLRLIADEVVGLRFEEAALRAVAPALANIGDDVGARQAWERIRAVRADDLQANRALSDIYRRLGELVSSDQAVQRALGGGTLSSADRAELYALLGSNSKRRWAEQWRGAGEQDRARVALQSRELEVSFQFYRRGFDENLNHWYSGLNALALAKVTLALADRCPDVWRTRFETNAEAGRELEQLRSEIAWLASTVRASLDSDRARSRYTGAVNLWLEVSAADLRLLTSNEPERVISAYVAAMSPALDSATRRSIRDQLEMYRDLGIFVETALPAFHLFAETSSGDSVLVHPLVFSGHMIDEPGRAHPRFPASQEGTAQNRIEQAIQDVVAAAQERQERMIGIAGVSDGGDLLFHETCQRLGVETHVLLPVPELAYRATAMSGQASRWADRYHAALRNATKVLTLARTDTLPGWLQGKTSYSTWQRNNRWILHYAWATTTADRVTVLALWNGEVGDGPGGVADMVATAQAGGAEVRTLDTFTIFDPSALELPQTPPAADAAAEPEADADPAKADIGGEQAPVEADKSGEQATVEARNPDAEGAVGDRVLNQVWRSHRQWSRAADAAQSRLNKWRGRNLALLVLGALAGALAAQAWAASAVTSAFAATSAALLAIAGLIQGTALTSADTSRWTGARAASEALKAEAYRFLARVKPYDGADRTEQLEAQLKAIQTRGQALLVDEQLFAPDNRALPQVSTFGGYLTARAQQQADWHRNKSAEHARKARTLRIWQLAATAAGAVLAAIGGALPQSHLAAWTAAATTVAAAFATHLAATQHQRIAASYAATADQLDRLIAGIDPATVGPDRQAQFVADVERVLAAQNDGWTDLLSPHAPKASEAAK